MAEELLANRGLIFVGKGFASMQKLTTDDTDNADFSGNGSFPSTGEADQAGGGQPFAKAIRIIRGSRHRTESAAAPATTCAKIPRTARCHWVRSLRSAPVPRTACAAPDNGRNARADRLRLSRQSRRTIPSTGASASLGGAGARGVGFPHAVARAGLVT